MMKFLMKRSFIHEEILQRGRRKYLALPVLPSRRFSFYHKAPKGAIDGGQSFLIKLIDRPENGGSQGMTINEIGQKYECKFNIVDGQYA